MVHLQHEEPSRNKKEQTVDTNKLFESQERLSE
jgi:hypothetical protein